MTDSIVTDVKSDLDARAELWLAKYGVTLDRTYLTRRQWLQHAYEEALDLSLYLKRAMADQCDGCIHAPKRDKQNFDEECMICSRFYADGFVSSEDRGDSE